MATNSTSGRASSVASSSGASFVDASGYKFNERDQKPVKIKLKKGAGKNGKTATEKDSDQTDLNGETGTAESRGSSSPILPEMDEKTMAAFPTGKPRETQLDTVICKHCKRPQLKQTAAEHIRSCLKAKQEKARKKKEARDAANRAKEKAADKDGNEKGDEGDEDGGAVKGQKSAKKSAGGEDGPKKSKKRKADDDDKDKEPKKKKKKEEPKPKVPKPKAPVDVERQCGVPLPNGGQCARSLTCKSHSMGAKRAVPGRSLPYDMLLQAYQKKNQARQQKAAIDANAPIQDDTENNGPIDSDEEKDAVMAGLARSRPQPLVTHPLIPTRRKYHLVRMKEMLSQVLGGTRGSLFGPPPDMNSPSTGRNLFQQADPGTFSPVTVSSADVPLQVPDPSNKRPPSVSQQAAQNRAAQAQAAAASAAAKKATAASAGS